MRDEKVILAEMDKMCASSLPPEFYEQWEVIRDMLAANRHVKPMYARQLEKEIFSYHFTR